MAYHQELEKRKVQLQSVSVLYIDMALLSVMASKSPVPSKMEGACRGKQEGYH